MNRVNKGYIGEFDFNLSGNLNDRVYLGVTFGLKDVHYDGESVYRETLNSVSSSAVGDVYVNDFRKITGTGFDIKAGVILRPFENSPFRVGLSVASPTWYDLTASNETRLVNNTSVAGLAKDANSSAAYSYKVYTPWKFGLSLGHTIGKNVALGAVYEYSDYSSLDSRTNDDGAYYDIYTDSYYTSSHSDETMNEHTQQTLKGVSTLKLGAEVKVSPEVSLRAGYNYVSSLYNKNGFKSDISLRKKASDEERITAKININQAIVETGVMIEYTCESLETYIESVNQLLIVDIVEPTTLKFNSDVERNWVQSGISLHENNSTCLFCGANLSPERKEVLRDYFNDAVKTTSQDIVKLFDELERLRTAVKKMINIDESRFMLIFHSQIKDLNLQLSEIREKKLNILDVIEAKLKEKQSNIFSIVEPVDLSDNNKDFDSFFESYKALYVDNYNRSSELENIKKTARDILLNDLIYQICDLYGYSKKNEELILEKAELDCKEGYIKGKEQDLQEAREKLNSLKKQTVDESIAADTINRLLAGLGNKSFTLVKSELDNHNGSYIIHDYNGAVRDIKSLSTGEKNIVAFLWFICNLENIELAEAKPQVVVFDDPMNSNDDTTQYLIISQLQKLIRDNEDKQIFLLTHNVHSK